MLYAFNRTSIVMKYVVRKYGMAGLEKEFYYGPAWIS